MLKSKRNITYIEYRKKYLSSNTFFHEIIKVLIFHAEQNSTKQASRCLKKLGQSL